ncbi:NAD-dependent epimerase/dehydratase family protein [Sphingobacterium sp.]|uniref:NAD-dependent epimerase/dehydratase family protein n=1 Tax=Sphingobacterium sp. TaxID=341027 RepID=UPI0028986539|nr:NAD-dependent epimerase/dehydratase family protein [Sphingobacterium sp.]
MKILISGASGFVGKNIIEYLQRFVGVEIQTISLREDGWEDFDFDGYDAIIHLAGKAHDTANTSEPKSYFEINRDLTIKLFEKFKYSNVNDFIFFSSVKSVADSVEGILDETIIPNPKTAYGKSKLEAEHYLISSELAKDKRVFVLRPCMIHGPGNKGNLNLLYSVVEKGISWPLASFDNQRSFLSVENLSFLVHEILKNRTLKSNIYNLADDDFISTNELVSLISNILGKKTRLLKINSALIRYVAKLGDFLPFPLNSERLKKLTESYRVSNLKIKEDLHLKNLPISTIDGLRITIESFKK